MRFLPVVIFWAIIAKIERALVFKTLTVFELTETIQN